MKHLIFSDAHAHPDFNNNRADWLGQLIYDVRPDVVVDLGDTADMPSLCSYDKNKRGFVGRSYLKDIEAHNEFQDRLWFRFKKLKRRMPRRVRLIGNHEQRIERVLDLSPELAGTVDYRDLELERYYQDIVYYNGSTPGTINIDGVVYGHYFTSGVMGRPISGEHQAYSLLAKKFVSCTQGHTHVYDHCIRMDQEGRVMNGLVTGCFMDYNAPWAGETNKMWWKGCFIKSNVYKGSYDLENVSMLALKEAYDQ